MTCVMIHNQRYFYINQPYNIYYIEFKQTQAINYRKAAAYDRR